MFLSPAGVLEAVGFKGACGWLMLLLFMKTPRAFSAKLLSSCLVSVSAGAWGGLFQGAGHGVALEAS